MEKEEGGKKVGDNGEVGEREGNRDGTTVKKRVKPE